MKPPVEHVRLSAKSKDFLTKIKRNTGLEHWNEICRIALCHSLANPIPPQKNERNGDRSIEIEWKTFAGAYQIELAALTLFRAAKDGIDLTKKELIADYFRNHLEQGIASIQNIKSIHAICFMD